MLVLQRPGQAQLSNLVKLHQKQVNGPKLLEKVALTETV